MVERGLLDTSVVVELERMPPSSLPDRQAVSALTLAELAAGPHATSDSAVRAARLARLQAVASTFQVLPFDDRCARACGQVYAATIDAGRKARGARAVDLLIAATALANELALCTTNPRDFTALRSLIEIVEVPASDPASG